MTPDLNGNNSEFNLTREESIHGILTMLDLIPDPALIYYKEQDRILAANNPLFLLTGLGDYDLVNQPITALLPNIEDSDPIRGHNKQAFIRHKVHPPIAVNVQIFSLTHTNETLIIFLKPEQVQSTLMQGKPGQTELIKRLRLLIQPQGTENIKSRLVQILRETASVLRTDVACIYTASRTQSTLDQYATNNERSALTLPGSLSKTDLEEDPLPSLWNLTKPVKTQLQRTAAINKLQYLATVPIQSGEKKFGLLVVGGSRFKPIPEIVPFTEVIAEFIAELLLNHVTNQNLRNLAVRIKQVVSIQSEIIKNLDEGVIILSPDLTIAEMNPSAESLLGYANIEALRQNINTIMIGSESLVSAFASAQQGVPTLSGGELFLHHRNGSSFPAQVLVSPVMKNEKLVSIIILIRDISEKEQSQATTKQLEQRAILGEVTAIFAHEVRNPINAIMLSLQVMEENLLEDDENQKWISNMRDECHKLLYLMDSVLSFAKPLEYKMHQVDLNELIPRLLERWRPRLMRLNISPFYETQVEDPFVEGDLRALDQVFTNLISNSVNAMSNDGGSLGIKLSTPEDEENCHFLKITLTDSGHGIPDEIKAHMFKPFVTGSTHGTGLGLAITQRIINAHKGKIEVDSFAGGTIFQIYLKRWKRTSER